MKIKHFVTPAVALTVFLTATITDAARWHRHHAPGVLGTITSMGTSGFELSVKAKASSSSTSSTLDVLCDANTRFMQGGKTIAASQITEGLTVRVIGATIAPNEFHAVTVTLEKSHHKSKTSE